MVSVTARAVNLDCSAEFLNFQDIKCCRVMTSYLLVVSGYVHVRDDGAVVCSASW